MGQLNMIWKNRKRILAGALAVVMGVSGSIVSIPAYGSNIWPQKSTAPFYCLDGGKSWRASDRYEIYQYDTLPSPLTELQAKRLFWAYPSNWNALKAAAAKYDSDLYSQIASVTSGPNVVKKIKDDKNTMFAWVADHPEVEERAIAALEKAASEAAESGKDAPEMIRNATSEERAVRITVPAFSDGPGALDTEFKLGEEFINDIVQIEAQSVWDNGASGGTVGWVDASQEKNLIKSVMGESLYEITWSGDSIKIHNNGSALANETVVGSELSKEERYNKTTVRYKISMRENSGWYTEAHWNQEYLREWMDFKACVNAPERQRLYMADIRIVPSNSEFYLVISQAEETKPVPPPEYGGETTDVSFQIYKHKEEFESTYHVKLQKIDDETEMPLKGSQFYLYERFDSDEMLGENEYHGALNRDKLSFRPWKGFQIVAEETTNEDGEIVHSDHRSYVYEKTYCDGHGIPEWVDEDSEDANKKVAAEWLELVDACEEKSRTSGGCHFHWMADEDSYDIVRSVYETGEAKDAGRSGTVKKETAFEQSGCKEDCEQTYENFINLRFSYTWKETQARMGYILHGIHNEDEAIEIVSTNSSEAGADAWRMSGTSEEIKENIWYSGNNINDRRSIAEETEVSQELVTVTEGQKLNEIQDERRVSKKKNKTATDSNGVIGTDSNAERASDSNAWNASIQESVPYWLQRRFDEEADDSEWENTGNVKSLEEYWKAAEVDGIKHLKKGASDQFSYCDENRDHWIVRDHRTEGEIHINKRDMDLFRGENDEYSSYGDTEGDGTLEGAVYGLFAADQLKHPDSDISENGKLTNTGVVYQAHDLAAIAVTDKEGNANFTTYTIAPGMTYDYARNQVVKRTDTEWDGPANRYEENREQYGNWWIGRPLLLGDYYVKELSRSEGYELSVNGKSDEVTNYGAELTTPETMTQVRGTTVISMPELSASMEGTEGKGMGYDELQFSVTSSGTTDASSDKQGYQLIISGLPEGVEFYRIDSGEQEVTGPRVVGTEEMIVRDVNGEIVWKTADTSSSHLKYEPIYDDAGNVMGQKPSIVTEPQSLTAEHIPEAVKMEITDWDMDMSDTIWNQNVSQEEAEEKSDLFYFLKAKVEEFLGQNGYQIPMTADGVCSRSDEPVFSVGVQKGDIDVYGMTTEAGQEAVKTVYGAAIERISVNSDAMTVKELFTEIIRWYYEHPWWSFGGLHAIEKNGTEYEIVLYAGASSESSRRFFTSKIEHGKMEVDRIYAVYENPYTLRWVYQEYDQSGKFQYQCRQRYSYGNGSEKRYYVDAVLTPAMMADENGNLQEITHNAMEYHEQGEEIRDYLLGDPENEYRVPVIQLVDKIEVTTENEIIEQDVRMEHVTYEKQSGIYRIFVDTEGTDVFGQDFSDRDGALTLAFTVKLPYQKVTVSESDIESFGKWNYGTYQAGDEIGYAEYLIQFQGVSIGITTGDLSSEDTFIVKKSLVYKGQYDVVEDGDTKHAPVQVLERPIKQKVKVIKTVDGEDAVSNFRFKIYLKSNLEHLYCDENGMVVWLDQFGVPVDIESYKNSYPELVQKIHTKKTQRAVLENVKQVTENEDGKKEEKETYNYEKFFDAIWTANIDKWDNKFGTALNTSWKPFAVSTITGIENLINTSEAARECAKRSDAVRQFASDWYLEEKIAEITEKLPNTEYVQAQNGQVSYSEEIYDQALYAAILEAETYLKVFFTYDLDSIYAVCWDSEDDGGSDNDRTTLAADVLEKEDGISFAYGVSKYLPYGDYVLTEQQPYCAEWSDYLNRHYKIDEPKEISIPVFYEEQEEIVYSSLVPWSITEPEKKQEFSGYASPIFVNKKYRVGLRAEKIDGETGEPILHTGAIFALYQAERDENPNGKGMVKRYETETLIYGSKGFLQAMGASEITPFRRHLENLAQLGAGMLYSGRVPAGTPICKEEDCILFSDENNVQLETFEGLSTVKACADLGILQTTGFFETPTPIEAGGYVLAELLPPAGYVRTKPVAVEIYSDSVVYYPNGDTKGKAAIRYGDQKFDGESLWKMDEEEARIFIENTATSLYVSKRKTGDTTRSMKVSGRVEGSITALTMMYGSENLEFAYNHAGIYLGFGWKKGTREYLEGRKKAGERVELVYENGVFQGYGYVTKTLETADDEKRQIPGATMALFEAIALEKSGDTEDFSYDGLCVERDKNGNVISMYVEGEHTGDKIPVLYYDLGGLQVIEKNLDGEMYGYDRECQKVKVTFDTSSLFAIRNGKAEFEISGGNLYELVYDAKEKAFTRIHEDTVIYHLDENSCRDSKVDPYMGLAFVNAPVSNTEKRKAEQIYVWSVTELRGTKGTIVAREKILTGRPGEMAAGTENAYITGTQNKDSQMFEKTMNPVYDRYGLVQYYPSNAYEYKKGSAQYDRDGEYIGYRYDDLLELYNQSAYGVLDPPALYQVGNPEDDTDDVSLLHRNGEAWIIPNIWVTGEENLLRRVIPGTYILEELNPPDGYVRALPLGVFVDETEKMQTISMTDERIKIEIAKIDGTDEYKKEVTSNWNEEEHLWGTEGSLAYSGTPVSGAKLALYRAERVYTSDYQTYPKGYYLRKTESSPASWYLDETVDKEPVCIEAVWISGSTPKYFEGIPAGDYILEELEVPDGYVPSSMEITVQEISELQSFTLKNDHTKLEICKYEEGENQNREMLTWPHIAEFALYPACLDRDGNVLKKDGEYVYENTPILQWKTGGQLQFSKEMTEAYETMFAFYKENFETFSWKINEDGAERWMSAKRLECNCSEDKEALVQLWKLDDDSQMKVAVHRDGNTNSENTGMLENISFEYQFNYVQGTLDGNSEVQMYDMENGIHRIDFLSPGNYILVETGVPEGYEESVPEWIEVKENETIQRYWVENKKKPVDEPKGTLIIEKTDREDQKKLSDVWFEVKNLQSGELWRIVTDEQGQAVLSGLPIQGMYESGVTGPVIYEIREIIPKEGYQKTSTVHQIRFRNNGQTEVVQYLNIQNEKTRIQIRKTDFANMSYVENATLAVYEARIQNGKYVAVGEALDRWISGEESHIIIGKLSCGKSYLLVEEEVPDGYVGAKPMRFTISEDGTRIIEIDDSVMQIRVLYDEAAEQIQSITVTGDAAVKREIVFDIGGNEIASVFAAGEEIRWEDICRKNQWELEEFEDQFITQKDYIHFSDESRMLIGQKYLQFHRECVDLLNHSGSWPIGTEYVMKNTDGIVLAKWILKDEDQTYTIENRQTHEGDWKFAAGQTYRLEEQVVFEDGSRVKIGILSVQFDATEQAAMVDIVNRETETEISKIVLTTGEEIPGAVLVIRDEHGTVIDEWTSGTETHVIKGILQVGKTYVLSETYAADGYAYAEDISFTVHEDGGITTVIMSDRPTEVEIRKIDVTTGKELPGAELVLKDSDGMVVDQWISGKDAHVIRGTLIAGETYTLQEIAAPDGYCLTETISFTVSRDGTVDRIVMENRQKEQEKKPEDMPEMPKPKVEPKKCGTIIAKYCPDAYADGALYLGKWNNPTITTPKTGDYPYPWEFVSGAILSLLGCVILFAAERNERNNGRKMERKKEKTKEKKRLD